MVSEAGTSTNLPQILLFRKYTMELTFQKPNEQYVITLLETEK